MRQVRVHGPGDVRVDDVGDPEPGPRDVVVDVAACGVCGSDLGYIRLGGLAGPSGSPMPLGHEMSGIVGWVGDEVRGVAVGDRVVVHPGDDELGRIGNGAPEGGLTPRLLVRDAARGDRLVGRARRAGPRGRGPGRAPGRRHARRRSRPTSAPATP